MKLEEEYEDILQNLEFAIVSLYRDNPDLTDHDVETTIGQLIRTYQAEQTGRQIILSNMTPLRQELYHSVYDMAEWRLERREMPDLTQGKKDKHFTLMINLNQEIDVDILLLCLKRIRKSIRFWTKKYGYQGYLEYIDNFLV